MLLIRNVPFWNAARTNDYVIAYVHELQPKSGYFENIWYDCLSPITHRTCNCALKMFHLKTKVMKRQIRARWACVETHTHQMPDFNL